MRRLAMVYEDHGGNSCCCGCDNHVDNVGELVNHDDQAELELQVAEHFPEAWAMVKPIVDLLKAENRLLKSKADWLAAELNLAYLEIKSGKLS